MIRVTNAIPLDVVFDQYFSGHCSPLFRDTYRGRLDNLDFTDVVLAKALEGIRDEINKRFSLNAPSIQSPDGNTAIHLDYLRSDELNAFAFFEKGVAFIALTGRLLESLIHISSQLWRLNLLHNLLRISLTPETRNLIAATMLPIQMQIVSSHEIGHIFHGHCGGSFANRLRAEDVSKLHFEGIDKSCGMRNHAMEVEADGYSAHMMLDNFFEGGIGDR